MEAGDLRFRSIDRLYLKFKADLLTLSVCHVGPLIASCLVPDAGVEVKLYSPARLSQHLAPQTADCKIYGKLQKR